ncbi:MAG: sulfatase [Planctomycetes bacterium]|nr:sulfatase [Planctomycetota bacterium]
MRRALASLLLALPAACGPAGPPGPGVELPEVAGLPAGIVLVVIDTLRADHTSLYGYARDTTPFLRELARESLVFERAYACATWTRPSMASVLTSRLPESHGCERRDSRLSESVVTLPEVLRDNGWDTRAVVANGNLADVFGFSQGFEWFKCPKGRPLAPYADAAFLQPLVQQVLSDLSVPPYFLWLHYVDPHEPYLPHPEHDWNPQYSGTFDGTDATLAPYRLRAPSPANRQRVVDLYDGEIAYVDKWLREHLRPLQESGRLDSCWLVVTSDHGEGLWDHQALGHCEEVFEGQVHVPLLIRPPGGLREPRRVPQVFSLLDLAPTLLELVGVPPCAEFDGKSWAPFLLGCGEAPERPAFVDQHVDDIALAAVISGRRKLIADARTQRVRFYDLATNPGELDELATDVSTDPTPPALELRDALEWAMSQAHAERPDDWRMPPEQVTQEVMDQLRALGYAGAPR